MQYHQVSSNIIQHHAISSNIKQYHLTSCDIVQQSNIIQHANDIQHHSISPKSFKFTKSVENSKNSLEM